MTSSLLTVPVIGKDIFRCGDPLTEENTYHGPRGKRECRKCRKAQSNDRHRRMRDGVNRCVKGCGVDLLPLRERWVRDPTHSGRKVVASIDQHTRAVASKKLPQGHGLPL